MDDQWVNKCHGGGNPPDGCCYVRGRPCPLRVENVDGRAYACRGMIEVGHDNLLHHPVYRSQVALVWREVEERTGRPLGSMDCNVWQGLIEPECCFAEPPELNRQRCEKAGVI